MVLVKVIFSLWLTCAVVTVTFAMPVVQPLPAALTSSATPSVRAQRLATLSVVRIGNRIVTAGERGIILLSDDDGHSWRQAKVPVQATLTALQFIDQKTGWAVGHFGVVLNTSDGGETWLLQLDGVRAAQLVKAAATNSEEKKFADQLIDEGPDKPLLALYFHDALNGIVIGAYNLALRTNDGGRSWKYVGFTLPNPRRFHLYGIASNSTQMLISGEQGLLMTSNDGGQTFRQVKPPYPGSYFGAIASSSGVMVAYGLRGTAYRSVNAGKSWEKSDVPTESSIGAGMLLSDGRMLLASQAGNLLVSHNSGKNFVSLGAPPVPVAAVAQTSNGNLILGTLRGPVIFPMPR